MALFEKPTYNTTVVQKKTAGGALVEGIFKGKSGDQIEGEKRGEAEAERIRAETEAAEKREGLAGVQAISFEGDAKTIITALSDLQTLATGHSGEGESKAAIRKAAWQKMELGIRMLRSEGDASNAEYFEKQLKGMKKKALLKVVIPVVLGSLAAILFLVWAVNYSGY